MAVEIKLPELGENISEGEVVRLLVKKGDQVSAGQPLLEIEADKATVEVPSPSAGRIVQIHCEKGDSVKIGQAILCLDSTNGDGAEPEPPSKKGDKAETSESKQEAKTKKAPNPTQERTEKEKHEKKEKPVEKENAEDKKEEFEQEKEFRPSKKAEEKNAAVKDTAEEKEDEQSKRSKERSTEKVTAVAPPSVRKFAREIGVDIARVRPSGKLPRITIEDVKAFARKQSVVLETGEGYFERFGKVKRERMSGVRKATARRMLQAWREIPHVAQFDEADVTELERMRKRLQERAEAAGAKLSVTAILLKAIANALVRFPKFNASLDARNEEVVFKEYVHVGVAVDTERGLLVPVLRDADRKNLIEIAADLEALARKARDGKLKREEMEGGCFTLSNMGGLGSGHFAPIVNPPEVAILAAGRATLLPRMAGEKVEPRLIMPLGLSYDHRLIDGADGTRFLCWLVDALEQPLLLAMET